METLGKNNDIHLTKWFVGTLTDKHTVADGVLSLSFVVPDAPVHVAGQHYDIKLTAPDGYVAERSYSIANAPNDKGIVEFGVELLENGEVSPFLHGMNFGDQIELRGPIGGHFVWMPAFENPLVLVGGGSGFVPLMSMVRQYVAGRKNNTQQKRDIRILISSRTLGRVLYYDELTVISQEYPEVQLSVTLTDVVPENWQGFSRRVDAEMVEVVCAGVVDDGRVYICGPTGFVEAMAGLLVDSGFDNERIKTERFGGK